MKPVQFKKCIKYETCAILHRYHTLYILRGCERKIKVPYTFQELYLFNTICIYIVRMCVIIVYACFLVVSLFFLTFWNTVKLTISLDPYESRNFTGTVLAPNCLQVLSA